jgi:prepilin-type N-terminal cleavage/methylation domain-containing protein
MRAEKANKQFGFTMVELMIAMVVGLIVLGAATQLFKAGTDAATTVTQRAEMQENARAALDLIAQDVSMAGAGLPPGGLALPNGTGSSIPMYAVNQLGTVWLNNNGYLTGTYGNPATLSNTVSNYMFAIIPGYQNGMERGGPTSIAATAQKADAITVAYVDYKFPLNQYAVSFPDPNGGSINVTPPAPLPAGFPLILDPTGIKLGDLIVLNGSNSANAVGEVTGITNAGGTLVFADNDPLKINQSTAANNNIKALTKSTATAWRLWVVTYFVEVPADGLPRLMRQVNGQTPVPVADDIIGLQFTYDMCDPSVTASPCANLGNPLGTAPAFSPNQIRKVNITVMGQSLTNNAGNKSKSMALSTSVSTRNLTFKDRYN